MFYTVDLAHYLEGQGYQYTESFDTGSTAETFTAKDYIKGLDDFTPAPGETVEVHVKIFHDGADPMFDDPIFEDKHDVSAE